LSREIFDREIFSGKIFNLWLPNKGDPRVNSFDPRDREREKISFLLCELSKERVTK